ncbi:SDR family oxidoreductase [Paenibacillus tianjinensis]|uniref:SDR family oxidoreductase n=1 Tax=Paenibacillus tianjinensis TaxID=2810347 RepID=A0ABX7LCI9_9BACL|nr:SDR family oxidoreductase [Paenibacillus tianjinensis]QSF44185.1 SDR family oxidoreductase [Paenibacillus tianjinensis]
MTSTGGSMKPSELQGNILITGVTGFIGRHVLYEFLNVAMETSWRNKIYILLRGKKGLSAAARVEHLLTHEYLPDYLKKYDYQELADNITAIDGNLEDSDLGLQVCSLIPREEQLYVIHNAGSVNLFNTAAAEQEVHHTNWLGTINLIHAIELFNSKLVFMSTAFSCGIVDGVIGDNFSFYQDNSFRNHYEKCKNLTEKFIQSYCTEKNIKYQILRPSVVCGRLIDAPLYYISKFDVFYGWTKFFWNLQNQGSTESVRIHISRNSKVNIVPVDFVAKSVLAFFQQDIPYVNIVYPESINNRYLHASLLDALHFNRYEFIDEAPTNLNKSEKLYYRSINKVYTPYLNQCSNEYDTQLIGSIMGSTVMPKIDLHSLADFSICNHFDEEMVY